MANTCNGIQQSRLNYIVIPVSLMYSVENISIGHSIYSDHSPVHLELMEKVASNKGRGFWKLNTSLLKDKEYVDSINKLIEIESIKQNGNNKGLIWDTIK
jgi:hypothetical protein